MILSCVGTSGHTRWLISAASSLRIGLLCGAPCLAVQMRAELHIGAGAAVHVDRLAGDKIGGVGSENSRQIPDVSWFAETAPRHGCFVDGGVVIGNARVITGHFDQAGGDGVDPYMMRRQFDGKVAGERGDRPLGGGVNSEVRDTGVGMDRRQIDDRTAACVLHMAPRLLGAENLTAHVDGEQFSKCAGVTSANGNVSVSPALLTSTSSPPR